MATRSPRTIPSRASALESRLTLSSTSRNVRRVLPQIEATFSGLSETLFFRPSTMLIGFVSVQQNPKRFPIVMIICELNVRFRVFGTIAQWDRDCKGNGLRTEGLTAGVPADITK